MSKTLIDGISAIRAEIDSVTAEVEWVQDSMLPPDEVKARVSASCKVLSQAHGLSLARLANPDAGMPELAEMLTALGNTQVFGGGEGRHVSVSVPLGGILAALLGDALVKKLHEGIDSLDYCPGPTSGDRPMALKGLRETLRGLEIREEAMICEAEEIGMFIPRRAEADPAIILGYTADGAQKDTSGKPVGAVEATAAIP